MLSQSWSANSGKPLRAILRIVGIPRESNAIGPHRKLFTKGGVYTEEAFLPIRRKIIPTNPTERNVG